MGSTCVGADVCGDLWGTRKLNNIVGGDMRPYDCAPVFSCGQFCGHERL